MSKGVMSEVKLKKKVDLLCDLSKDKEVVYLLSKDKIKKCIRNLSKVKETKYRRRNITKYGLLGYKAMPLHIVDKFFSSFKPEEYRYKVLFLTQAFFGLRIGEVVQLNLKDIDFQNKQVLIHSEKKHFKATDFLFLHEKLEFLFIQLYEKEIKEHGGFLFFSSTKRCKFPYVSPDSARNIFVRVRSRAGLNEKYGEREGISGLPFREGDLHRWTTHSIRHTFGKFLAKRHIPIEIAKHLLRHSDIKATQIYYVPDKEDVDKTMEVLFQRNPNKKFFIEK